MCVCTWYVCCVFNVNVALATHTSRTQSFTLPPPPTHTHTALPLYSVTRAFCKTLLCDTFSALLVPEGDTPLNQTTVVESLEAFKWTLSLSKEVNSYLLSTQGSDKPLTAVAQCSDSGTGLKLRVCVNVGRCV